MNRQRILDTMLELCAIPSISETKGEIEAPLKMVKILERLSYFKTNPHHLQLHTMPNDPLNRTYITAFMEGAVPSNKTVILLSHYDVVGIDEFGMLKKYAFHPILYTEHLKTTKSIELPQEALKDLNSGDYLFGRGIMDMKYGIAAHIEVLYEIEKNLDTFQGNILLLSVPDEETNSAGMLSAVEFLLSLKQEKNLEYLCAIISEPHFPKYPGDDNIYIYNGTVGKLLPVFYCVGKETHVGEPFAGINPNMLTGKLLERIHQNPHLSDTLGEIYTPAPTCLKQSDTKKDYSVQTPVAAYTYFNFVTLTSTPVVSSLTLFFY
ncbi:Peptidase family M20/M25/M40 [Natronincola peptidivorans]|uniref:Peptidase family M20/M25/M40 n=1 Tax=Natronincola peptidivorans TaxID=426128 RepID=A0A1I0ETM1_9FIRM|nr:M20/M25/M40 family metallo-hydrolase [Natronincola peptidivorans]SET48622.1 Peptidase family M20/M25/M40 [Natronincola peptidivorans]